MHVDSLKKNRVGNGGERETEGQEYWGERSQGGRTGKRGRGREGGKSRRDGERGVRDQEREGRIFKGNCDQQRESVHQKANEWKSNGLDWMGAMVFAWGLQRTLFLFCVTGKPMKLLEREATAQD